MLRYCKAPTPFGTLPWAMCGDALEALGLPDDPARAAEEYAAGRFHPFTYVDGEHSGLAVHE